MQAHARKRPNDYSTSLLDLCSCGLAILLLLLVLFVPQPRGSVSAESTGSGTVERFVSLEVMGESTIVPRNPHPASMLRLNGQRVDLGFRQTRVPLDIPSLGVRGSYEVRVIRKQSGGQVVHQVTLQMEEVDRLAIHLTILAEPEWNYSGQVSTASGDAGGITSYTNVSRPQVIWFPFGKVTFRGATEPATATVIVDWPAGDHPRFSNMKIEQGVSP